MSLRIHWEPKDRSEKFTSGGSTELIALRAAFPHAEIGPEDLDTLRALRIASGNPFYLEVIQAVENYGRIVFWGVS